MKNSTKGQMDDAYHVARANRALRWLACELPAATVREVNPEDGLLGVEWRGWSIEINPYGCSSPGDKSLPTTIRRGEMLHKKLYSNLIHMANSIKKVARENP